MHVCTTTLQFSFLEIDTSFQDSDASAQKTHPKLVLPDHPIFRLGHLDTFLKVPSLF